MHKINAVNNEEKIPTFIKSHLLNDSMALIDMAVKVIAVVVTAH